MIVNCAEYGGERAKRKVTASISDGSLFIELHARLRIQTQPSSWGKKDLTWMAAYHTVVADFSN